MSWFCTTHLFINLCVQVYGAELYNNTSWWLIIAPCLLGTTSTVSYSVNLLKPFECYKIKDRRTDRHYLPIKSPCSRLKITDNFVIKNNFGWQYRFSQKGNKIGLYLMKKSVFSTWILVPLCLFPLL